MAEALRPIIVHTQEHVLAALDAAAETQKPLAMMSAPDAIHYAGSLYLLHMYAQAKKYYPQVEARFIVDCGDAGAEAVSAMQTGHRWLYVSAAREMQVRLADIAEQLGVQMVAKPVEKLDLQFAADPAKACAQWLADR